MSLTDSANGFSRSWRLCALCCYNMGSFSARVIRWELNCDRKQFSRNAISYSNGFLHVWHEWNAWLLIELNEPTDANGRVLWLTAITCRSTCDPRSTTQVIDDVSRCPLKSILVHSSQTLPACLHQSFTFRLFLFWPWVTLNGRSRTRIARVSTSI